MIWYHPIFIGYFAISRRFSPRKHAEHRAGAAHVPDASAWADSAAPGRSGRMFDTGEEALIHKSIGLWKYMEMKGSHRSVNYIGLWCLSYSLLCYSANILTIALDHFYSIVRGCGSRPFLNQCLVFEPELSGIPMLRWGWLGDLGKRWGCTVSYGFVVGGYLQGNAPVQTPWTKRRWTPGCNCGTASLLWFAAREQVVFDSYMFFR